MSGYCSDCGNTMCICGEMKTWDDMKNKVKALEAELSEAKELIKRGTHFSGHYSDCSDESDDEECTCGANRFEFDAHIFLSKHPVSP